MVVHPFLQIASEISFETITGEHQNDKAVTICQLYKKLRTPRSVAFPAKENFAKQLQTHYTETHFHYNLKR